MRIAILVMVALILCWGCNSDVINGGQLSKSEIAYIQRLGILNEGEAIHLFTSQAGFKGLEQAGNFFTDYRIAAYWIDDKRPEENVINYTFFEDVEKMTLTDLSTKISYSSYIEVLTYEGKTFKVYIDADSTATWGFYNDAVEVWQKRSI